MYDLCPEGRGVTVIIGHRVISVTFIMKILFMRYILHLLNKIRSFSLIPRNVPFSSLLYPVYIKKCSHQLSNISSCIQHAGINSYIKKINTIIFAHCLTFVIKGVSWYVFVFQYLVYT